MTRHDADLALGSLRADERRLAGPEQSLDGDEIN
jgi:hypothetical protein